MRDFIEAGRWWKREHDRLRAAIEDYLLWEPGRKGHAAAHKRLRDSLEGLDPSPEALDLRSAAGEEGGS